MFNRYRVSGLQEAICGWMVVLAAQQCGTYLMPLNGTLKNGEDGKFYVMCILPLIVFKIV